jgi:RHS repeat-associated protein
MPEPVLGLFNSSYTYDLAGNLLTLKRFGLEDPTVMGTTPFMIDELVYGYQGSSRLMNVKDETAQPQGFSPGFSGYGYDAAGNLITDGGKDLTIDYNLLNLPGTITHSTDGAIRYAYTYGGHKFLKETELAGEEEERLYLGGAEFVNGQPESYYHGEGRVALTGDKPAFQYKLTDHLGNTMVLFEDKDEDGIITTESNPAENEVLQRNFYYAFGLPIQGSWNHTPTDPAMPYLYNGKELEGELGLGWYAYGARNYNPATCRFNTIDRFSNKFPWQSPYLYAGNDPVKHIDVNGDSLLIRIGKGDVAFYENGQVFNRDGSQYNGKGVKTRKDGTVKLNRDGTVKMRGFLKETVSALDKINNGGAAGNALISQLVEAEDKFVISEGGFNSNRGQTVTFNPLSTNSGLDEYGNTYRPAYIGLAHELAHALDWNMGTIDLGVWVKYSDGTTSSNSEKFASHIENQIRAENGVPLRAYYGIDNGNGVGMLIYPGTRFSSNYFIRTGLPIMPYFPYPYP